MPLYGNMPTMFLADRQPTVYADIELNRLVREPNNHSFLRINMNLYKTCFLTLTDRVGKCYYHGTGHDLGEATTMHVPSN